MSIFNPKFLYKNYIDDVSQISDSASVADIVKKRLFDRNTEIQYQSLGVTTGTRTITWTPNAATTVDRIILQNINWKDFTIKYNTSNDFTPTIAVTGNTDTNIYIEVASQSVTNIIFSVTDTITASETANVGQIIVTEEIMELATATAYEVDILPRVQQTNLTLSDGASDKTYVRSLYDFQIRLDQAATTERTSLLSVFNENRRERIIFIPNPKTQSDVFDGIAPSVNWANAFMIENNPLKLEINGYEGVIELTQA